MIKSKDSKQFRIKLNDGYVENFILLENFHYSRNEDGLLSTIIGCNFEKSVTMEMIDNHDSVIFEDCIFEGMVKFHLSNFDKGLIFKNCVFHNELEIAACTFNNELSFLNCSLNSKLQINSSSAKELNFDSGHFAEIMIKGKFNFQKELGILNFKSGNFQFVHINSSQINAEMNLTGGEFDRFYIIDSTIYGEIKTDGSELVLGSLIFSSCKLHSRIDLRTCFIQNFLKFNKVICLEELLISEHVFAQFIDLQGFTASERVKITFQDNFDMLTLSDCDFKTSFECNSLVAEYVALTSSFSVHFDGILRGSIVYWDLPISDIYLHCSNFGNITFRDIDTNCIIISGFQNHNKVTFANIEIIAGRSSLNIVDSDLDKTLFLNLNCSNFTEVVIAKSDISNVTFSNCILPINILLGSSDPAVGYGVKRSDNVNRSSYHRENHRQLKIAMEKQGNHSAALQYKTKEMHYLRREKNWGWDKVLLYLNFLSNNHGLSWSRALLFTIGMSFILYLCYERTCTVPRYNLDAFFKYASSFPLYKSQSELALSWPTYLVIMLSRVLIGYGIYQFIVAFRKFASK